MFDEEGADKREARLSYLHALGNGGEGHARVRARIPKLEFAIRA